MHAQGSCDVAYKLTSLQAGKGTIQRASANILYKKEITEMYAKLDASNDGAQTPSLDLSSEDALAESIRAAFANAIDLRSGSLSLTLALGINVAGGTMGGRDEREIGSKGLAGWAHGGMLGGSTNGQGRDTTLG